MHFFFIILILFPVVLIAFTYGITFLCKKEEDRRKAVSRIKYVMAALLIVEGWFYFFEDKEVLLDCRKDTLLCSYARSTIADTDLRFVETYDLKDVDYAKVREVKRHRRYSSYYVYQIVFQSKDQEQVFPYDFTFKEDADDEIKKINRFLKTDQKRYVYHSGSKELSEFDKGIMYSFYMTALFLLLQMLYEWRTKRD